MEFVYLSCPGYFENTHECVLYYYRSGRETLRAMLIAFSGEPSTPCWNSTCCFPVFDKNCSLQVRTSQASVLPQLHSLSCAPHQTHLDVTHPIAMQERGDAGPGLLCAGGEVLLNGSVQLLPAYVESYWNPTAAPGKPSLTLSDDWIGPMLSKPAQLHRCSPPTYTCPPITISSDLITAILWFSLLHLNICWVFLAQHGRALSWFTAYLVLTTSEIPAINMLPLESKPITGVSAGYNYIHRLVLILCQLIITANFKTVVLKLFIVIRMNRMT